ncbi:PREDICTED: uncharacterized protein At3g27210 isoform X1 [Brassica oleracea var. oleracea]|uniref:Uncharacterized protein n=1 Tax=Brassica oleracea var. oleracea TaxID=109376 RepID=A0A0D3DB75_BRAOL|nr:PREDICTED: uncharacterized protein At3g27210 isoform X1 [Brassica oleracea var. oleracea]
MGSYSSSSLNNSPFGTERMVTPESPTKDTNSAPMPVKNDGVTIISNSLYSSSPSAKKIFESPRKSTTSVPVASPAVKSRWSFSSSKKSFGSKDETFFDTQQWLQSDSDDDFHSVNGDFTPSRGNTPKSSFSDRLPRINNLIFHEKKPSRGSSPAPKPRRKKLGDLFRESIREEREESSGGSSSLSSPYHSGEFNKVAIEEDSSIKEEKKKSNWQHHRCLPGFSACGGSFMERRKKMSSETGVVAVK